MLECRQSNVSPHHKLTQSATTATWHVLTTIAGCGRVMSSRGAGRQRGASDGRRRQDRSSFHPLAAAAAADAVLVRRGMKHAVTIIHLQRVHSAVTSISQTAQRLSSSHCASIHGCHRLLLCCHPQLATDIAVRSSIATLSTSTTPTSLNTATTPAAASSSAHASTSLPSTSVHRASLTNAVQPTNMPHNAPPYSLPPSALRSDSHIFTTREMDIYRLYALLATSAASNQLAFLAHLSTYIPFGYEAEAAESILLVQVYAGIPKTIEGMTVVRDELDRREEWMKEGGVEGRVLKVRERREKSRSEIARVMGKVGEALTTRWQMYDEPDRPPPSPSLSVSPDYPSLPAVHPSSSSSPPPPSAPPSSASSSSPADINSTDARIQRGMLALHSVYSTATVKLLASLHHLHPSLHHSVLQHIYGAVLCTPILTLPAMELASVACLMGERSSRQLFSHVRGALMNGCTREMVECVMRDAEKVYREARRKEEEEAWGWVEEAVTLVRKIDRKVNPEKYGQDHEKEEKERGARVLEEDRRAEVQRVVSRRTKESGRQDTEELALKRSFSAPPAAKL